ncbi:hypothetical protein DXF85_02990 [Citrobacter pasteurii]|uniref:DinI family protein n=1 Tax=Citrobacter pasteurii TaxID=1563222 RepID=A0A6N6K7A1_9ENTR|nr:hypothetical protein DXF85_02990 [Citrobacter pasteurii]
MTANPDDVSSTLLSINADSSKNEKEQIIRTVQEMFEEADMWLVSD